MHLEIMHSIVIKLTLYIRFRQSPGPFCGGPVLVGFLTETATPQSDLQGLPGAPEVGSNTAHIICSKQNRCNSSGVHGLHASLHDEHGVPYVRVPAYRNATIIRG